MEKSEKNSIKIHVLHLYKVIKEIRIGIFSFHHFVVSPFKAFSPAQLSPLKHQARVLCYAMNDSCLKYFYFIFYFAIYRIL